MHEFITSIYFRYDHSCKPNSLYSHDGFIAILRPLFSEVSLADRSKTFYTYIDLLQTKEERQRGLSESWYFDCKCTRCLDDCDHLLTAIKCGDCQAAVSIFSGSRSKSRSMINCEKCGHQIEESRLQEGVVAMRRIDLFVNDERLQTLENQTVSNQVDELLNEFSKILPFCNIYLVRLLRLAIMRSDSNDIARLLRYHEQALDSMRLCYPINHPSLAYHLMNIGVFHGRLNNAEDSRRFLEEAKNMFVFTLGEDHFLTKSACDELSKLSRPFLSCK